ncbi:MAG TPA: hypothetical protein DCP31_40140, partial [Cyanobacteria bacterium UBA8543]|nr:hypothetical protein [Cyanobacteria bacterium UBA8543]
YLQQALAIAQEIGDKAGAGITLNNIGAVYDNQGQYPQALKSYQQALAIAQEIGNKAGAGTALNNIGVVYNSQGQYSKALEYHQQALPIRQAIGDKVGEGSTLHNLGAVYDNLGQYSQALEYYQQALAIRQKIGDKKGEGTTLNNIGEVYSNLGQYPQALKSNQQALAIAQEIGDKAGEGTTLKSLGLLYLNQGQDLQALKYLQQALAIHKAIGDKASEGITFINIGFVYRNQGQYSQALNYYQQALAIHQAIGNRSAEGGTLNNIGELYDSQGQYSQAETTLGETIEVWESLRTRDLKDDQKVSIFDIQASTYSLLQNTLVAQNKSEQALVIAERSRARALVELLDSKLSEKPNNQTNIKPPILTEIKQIASQQNATLVQYSIVNEPFKVAGKQEWQQSKLYIWVIKPTGEIAFEQVDLKKSLNTSLQELVTTSRQSIGVRGRSLEISFEPGLDQSDRLKQLHKVLVEPIAKYLPSDPNDSVIFIPQNELFLAPFPALQDDGGKYLIQKHTILSAPSIQVLQLTHEKRPRVSGNGVLVVGNPTMPKVTTKVGEASQQLTNLPGAEKEATTIAFLFNTKALTGNLATKTAVLPKLSNARIIHLATHGLLDDFKGLGVPGAIALAPNGTGELNDGLLTCNEIFDLKLNAELVVLSACDTGRGNLTGDGVIGLSRSLITAGVPSIIVSLWSVPDAPTASLMTQFYQNLQKNPDKAQALRQAMLTTMATHPNPRDWAAFTLIGEAQ